MKTRIFVFITILLLTCSLLLLFTCDEPPVNLEIGVTQRPEFGIGEGSYNKDIEVVISCPTDGAVIYYTLDGTAPGTGSLIYSAAISVSGDGNNLLIKAAAKCQDMELSAIASASYTISYLDLVIQVSANGSTTPTGAHKAAKDSKVNITAIPDAGYAFSHWSVEDGTGVIIDDIYAESTSVTLTETGGTIQANFGLAFSLRIGSSGYGTTTPDGEVFVVSGIPRTITADPEAGYEFSHWSVESGSGVTFSDEYSESTTVTLTDGDSTIQANFVNWVSQAKLTAADGAANDYFGRSVSISGDYAVVGANEDDDNGSSSGSAYIFFREGTSWIRQAKLTAEDGAVGDYFGWSVSISGDYALVGAFDDDDNGSTSGSAYIFIRDGTSWVQQAKLTADDGATNDSFGRSVSISGGYAVVGAHGDDDNGSLSGSAYIFVRGGTSWTQQAKLTASDGAESDLFGYSVSISGDYAMVGACQDDDNGSTSGSAYIFVRDGSSWIQQAKLTASDGAASDNFGYSVSISDAYAVVGAVNDDDNGSSSGSAYIFARDDSSWAQQTKLTASDGAAEDFFGWAVSISGDHAVVGAHHDDDNGSYSGSAYIFVRGGTSWTQQAKLTASDGAANELFGYSVSIFGDYAMVGACLDDDNGSGSGSAYIIW